jgi:hypothetical protein
MYECSGSTELACSVDIALGQSGIPNCSPSLLWGITNIRLNQKSSSSPGRQPSS